MEIIWYIKEFRCDNVIIDINYKYENLEQTFKNDIKAFHIGLVVVSKDMFSNDKTRKMLYESHVPVLKISGY